MNSFYAKLQLFISALFINLAVASCVTHLQHSQSYPSATDTISENDTIAGFLMDIDFSVNAIAPEHPQLADWNLIRHDTRWRASGKIIWEGHLAYNHAMDPYKTADNYLKLYKKDGCTIVIHVYTPKEFRYVNRSGMKNQIYGMKMGRFSVIASVISENPNLPEFDQLMLDLIKRTMTKWGHLED